MNNELKKIIDEYLLEFKSLPVVKNYLSLKQKMVSDVFYLNLKEELKNAQKELALSIGKDSYSKNKIKYESIKNQFDNHPYNINYQIFNDEINHLLKEIESLIKPL